MKVTNANEYALIHPRETTRIVAEEHSEPGLPDRAIPPLHHHRRRRHLIDCLREFDEPISLPDLADEVAIREQQVELTDIPAEDVKDIYLSLYHNHIPKLANAGVIEYDQESDLVLQTEQVDRMHPDEGRTSE